MANQALGKFLGIVFIPWCSTEILSNCNAQPWWWDKFQWDYFSEVLGLVKDPSNYHWVPLSGVWLSFLNTWRGLLQLFIGFGKIIWAVVRQKSLSALLIWQGSSSLTSWCLSMVSLPCAYVFVLETHFLKQPGKCCWPSLLQEPLGGLEWTSWLRSFSAKLLSSCSQLHAMLRNHWSSSLYNFIVPQISQ